VDLRDGNQALPTPMGIQQKLDFFRMLVKIGFKQIEVGFPAASATEFAFVRKLIEQNLIPDDVTIQVLVSAREEHIKTTVQSLVGMTKVIIHMYNSTSPAQRKITFGLTKAEVVDLAVRGVEWVKKYSAKNLKGTKVTLQYSPESFSATELPFSLRICRAVMAVWQPTPANRMILNLPATVEAAIPNHYADQIEWFCTHLTRRERWSVVVSVHTHNDRGTGIAATELALLAGANRVEGTLFGNGERTGNADLVTLALNLYTHGIDPMLDFSNINDVIKVYEECTGMRVHERQAYAGSLVHTAFSGSHQDAIKKGLAAQKKILWEVPYLPIDPADIGRSYQPVIRINSQSGKGGIAHILQTECGIRMPREVEIEFGKIAGKEIDALGREVSGEELKEMFLRIFQRSDTYELKSFNSSEVGGVIHAVSSVFHVVCNELYTFTGQGNGPVDAFVKSLGSLGLISVSDEQIFALSNGSSAGAIAYVLVQGNGQQYWGAGVDTNTQTALIKAVISGLNRVCWSRTG